MGMSAWYGPTDDEESIATIHRALELGVTLLDTADVYGQGANEELVGRAIADRRDEVVLATKFGNRWFDDGTRTIDGSPEYVRDAIDASLRRLKVDYVDLYYPHQLDPQTPLDETLRAIEDLVRSGKVLYVGLSNHPAWKTIEALWLADRHGYQPISCVQVLYNLLDREIEREIVPCCDAHGLGLVPYSPLAGGVLTGKYNAGTEAIPSDSRAARSGFRMDGRPSHTPVLSQRNLRVAQQVSRLSAAFGLSAASLAVAWILHQPMISSVIVGASTASQLEATLAAADVRLSPDQLAEVAAAAEES